jgi:DNA-binding MarR family transcriptional regulator
MPDDDPLMGYRLTATPGHLLRRCQQRGVDLYLAEVGEDRLTPRQFAALLCIYQNPGISQTALVRLSGIDRSTLGEMARRLIDRGLIRRRRKAADQRANALTTTNAGAAALRAALPGVQRAQRRILEPLPEAHRDRLLELLKAIADLPIDGGGRRR